MGIFGYEVSNEQRILSLLELRSAYFSELTLGYQNKVQHPAILCWVFLLSNRSYNQKDRNA